MRTTTALAAAIGLMAALSGCARIGSLATTQPPGTAPLSPATSTPGATPAVEAKPSPRLDPTTPATPNPKPPPTPTATPRDDDDLPRRVPNVVIRTTKTTLDLRPWTCWTDGCLDGLPPRQPSSIGSAESAEVAFPVGDWKFIATFTESGVRCARSQTVELEQTGKTTWLLEPAGYAGPYDVDVSGHGPGGDVVVTVRWETPRDGPIARPRAMLAVIAGRDSVTSYGVTLSITNLAATPETARAEVTVTAANGESLAFELSDLTRGCAAEGFLHWNGPDQAGMQAADLGPPPFAYDVALTLDGDRYEGSGTWPDGEIEDYEPFVELDFSPPLPALQPRS